MRKILVIGAKGMLGTAVTRYFERRGWEVVGLSRQEFDLARRPSEDLLPYLAACDVVVNCAGVIKPRIAVTSLEDLLRINAVFPHNLATLAQRVGVPCFHITTDCVYSGKKGNYSENDLCDATDSYGLSKFAGDNRDCMTLRTSIIGEERGQARSLLEWARSQAGKEVNGFTNHFWNGVTTVYLAEIIEKIIIDNLYRPGIFHIYSPEVVTKLRLLQIFDEVYQLALQIKPVEASEAIDRSLTSIYDLATKVCRLSIKEQVQAMRAFFETE